MESLTFQQAQSELGRPVISTRSRSAKRSTPRDDPSVIASLAARKCQVCRKIRVYNVPCASKICQHCEQLPIKKDRQ